MLEWPAPSMAREFFAPIDINFTSIYIKQDGIIRNWIGVNTNR